MSPTWRVRFGAVGAVVVIAVLGCGGTGPPGAGKAADTRSPAQYFRERQATTITPHGKIRTDTVEERGGKLEYQTGDGKRWRLDYAKRADGTYDYGTPDELK